MVNHVQMDSEMLRAMMAGPVGQGQGEGQGQGGGRGQRASANRTLSSSLSLFGTERLLRGNDRGVREGEGEGRLIRRVV